MKAVRNASIAGKGEHHSRVAGQAEEAAVPNAQHDQDHQHDASCVAAGILQDLQHGLRGSKDCVKVLDGEEEAAEDKEAGDRRYEDGTQQAQWCISYGLSSFLAKMCRGVKSQDGILGH